MTPPYAEEFYEMIIADKSVDSQYDFSINFFQKIIQQFSKWHIIHNLMYTRSDIKYISEFDSLQ